MLNKDLLQAQNKDLMQKLSQALKEDDSDKMAEYLQQFSEGVQDCILQEYADLRGTNDTAILAQRGIRQLTSEEKEFYEKWAEAGKSDNPKQALTDIAKAKSNSARAADVVRNWLRNRGTLEYLSVWEQIYNPEFKVFESEHFKKQVGLLTFTPSVSEWINKTNAIKTTVYVKKRTVYVKKEPFM